MIKCALVSGKEMGLLHGRNFHSLPDARIVATCDKEPLLRERLQKEFPAPIYPTLEAMLAHSDAELVLLITNETRRIEPLRQVIAAGRHVFTEKPLCGLEGQYRVREADAAVAWPAIRDWRRSGVKFGINYNYRYFTHFRKLHEDVVSGRLGEVQMVRARAHLNCWSHVIDQILWTMGRPDWVSALGDPTRPGVWPRLIHMKWPSGALGALDGTNAWGYDDHPLRIMIVGQRSYAEARGLGGWYRRCKADAWQQEVEELWQVEGPYTEYDASFARMAQAVIQALKDGQPMPADGEAAWNELVFEAAVHRSALHDGQRVFLADVEAAAARTADGDPKGERNGS